MSALILVSNPLYEGVDYSAYFGLLLLTTLAWAIVVEHYDLSHVDYLVPSRNATRRALVASIATYVVATGATFFYRTVSFSRLFVVFSGVALFILVFATQAAFRVYLESLRRRGENCSRLLVIGADEYASRTVRSLLRVDGDPLQRGGVRSITWTDPIPSLHPPAGI